MNAELRSQSLALSIGLFCGVSAFFAGLPLPWMLGPMIGNTVGAILHAPVTAPNRLRPFVIPVIGVMLGSAVTSDIFGLLGSWVSTLILLPVFLCVAATASYTVYRRIGGFDPVTSFYAAMPGGLNEMLILGAEAGGDERRIALAHAARILVVIIFVAIFFGLFLGVSSGSRGALNWVGFSALTVMDYMVLGLCAFGGFWLGKLLRLPAAPVFGPLILSGAAHIIGWVTVAPPTVFVIAAQVTMGTIIGTRFAGATFAEVRRDLGLAMLATLGMLIITVIFAAIIAGLSGLPLAQAFLAYSPGGLTEMSLLTLAMDQDVVYVSVMHVIRITLVIAIASTIFKLIGIGRHG